MVIITFLQKDAHCPRQSTLQMTVIQGFLCLGAYSWLSNCASPTLINPKRQSLHQLSNNWRALKPTWTTVHLFLHPLPGFVKSQARSGLPTKPFFSSYCSGDAHAPCTQAGTAMFPTHTITMDYYCSCASLLNPIYIYTHIYILNAAE